MFRSRPFPPLRILLLALGLLAARPAAAQAGGRRPFATLGPEQGLPSGAVICLTQDRNGFLWFGTENGLLRYEGGRCQQWSLQDGLPSAYIAQVVPDAQGGVWVATLRGLVHVDHGHIQPVELGSAPGRPGVPIIALDRQGRLWAMDRHHLFVQRAGLEFRELPDRLQAEPSTLTLGAQTGTMYVSGREGLQAFRPDGSRQAWGPKEGLPAQGTVLVAEDGQGRLWTGVGRHLCLLPPGGKRFVDASRRLPGSLTVSGLPFRDADGSVWFPTQAGALRLAGDQDEVLDAAVGLPFRWVRTVFRDREGSLWVLGPALARLLGDGKVRNYTLSHGPFGEVVWYITQDLQGRLLVATDDGAARMGPDGLERIPGTEGRRIKCLALAPDGTLWMVTTIGPTLWLRPGHRQAERALVGELGDRVNTVFRDREGRIWLGSTHAGVLRWDAAARRLVQDAGPALCGAANLGAYAFSEDAQGRLWVGSTGGLLVRERGGHWLRFSDRDGLLPYTVYGVAFLPDGTAWLHYQEPEGLTRIRLDGTRLQILERRTKGTDLPTGLVYAVTVDAAGQTWFTTDQGLMRLDPALHLGRDEGMASEDCAILALKAEGRKIWVGTAAGLVSFDTRAPGTAPAPPATFLTRVEVGPRRLPSPFSTPAPIPARLGTVEFRFASPSYVNERDLRLQVRLVGLEDAWRETSSRVSRYPALPGGHYRFEARAAQGKGPFGPAATFSFSILPPWWKRGWAITAAACLASAIIYLVFRLRLASLAHSKVMLEAEVDLRTRELRTRNEELSEALANVKRLSGLLPICASCKKIRDDKGYWNQLEQYISERTDAGFSHGICPECAQELYPEAQRHKPRTV